MGQLGKGVWTVFVTDEREPLLTSSQRGMAFSMELREPSDLTNISFDDSETANPYERFSRLSGM